MHESMLLVSFPRLVSDLQLTMKCLSLTQSSSLSSVLTLLSDQKDELELTNCDFMLKSDPEVTLHPDRNIRGALGALVLLPKKTVVQYF